ncbi:hypothetical protein OKW76_05415 [Sphingomonas sp. S1-29]|uniref:hypothetical protein n=1 Tax=Sphingomonas sp. S1-29 TaxID=2991074 RepID=UPI0022401C47|nr:hypothetical protein [Sphingomonas sp. S1-29]UZK70483.1 hypothetical protein OKW76_05415 [Sphingomonas sp. S1-29]
MTKKIRNPLREARKSYDTKASIYLAKALHASERLASSEAEAAVIRSLLGVGGNTQGIVRSDVGACRQASRIFARAMLRHRQANPGMSYYLVTMFDDEGLTSDRLPICRSDFLMAKARRAIAKLNLSAVLATDVCAIMNYSNDGAGRTLSFHIHGIAWGSSEKKIKKGVKKLNSSGAWVCKFGAVPIKITKINDSKADMFRASLYCIKLPCSAKNLRKKRTDDGKTMFMDTIKGYRPELALRMAEGLSQIDFISTIAGTKGGAGIRQEIRQELNEWKKAKSIAAEKKPVDFDVWAFWARLREHQGSRNFMPYRFDRMSRPEKRRQATGRIANTIHRIGARPQSVHTSVSSPHSIRSRQKHARQDKKSSSS